MGMKTGVIRFNVKERGRQFRGQNRLLDTAALALVINGGSVQERVKNGDLLGYYGHWPRLKFGLDLSEGGLVNGKPIAVEPAIRTLSIKAYPDGTIEHEAEFLDTESGRLAQRLFQSKAGGFSSAIHAPKRGSQNVPEDFHGFDYVLEPNYTTNRGYLLDSAGNPIDLDALADEEVVLLDEVQQYNSLLDSTNALLDRMQGDYDRLAEVVDQLQQENVELYSILARNKPQKASVLDSAGAVDVVSFATSNRFDRADDFEQARLEGYEQSKAADKPESAGDRFIYDRFGI